MIDIQRERWPNCIGYRFLICATLCEKPDHQLFRPPRRSRSSGCGQYLHIPYSGLVLQRLQGRHKLTRIAYGGRHVGIAVKNPNGNVVNGLRETGISITDTIAVPPFPKTSGLARQVAFQIENRCIATTRQNWVFFSWLFDQNAIPIAVWGEEWPDRRYISPPDRCRVELIYRTQIELLIRHKDRTRSVR